MAGEFNGKGPELAGKAQEMADEEWKDAGGCRIDKGEVEGEGDYGKNLRLLVGQNRIV